MKKKVISKATAKRLQKPQTRPPGSGLLKRLRTAIGAMLVVIIAYLLLVLLGYHPDDPSWANNVPADQTRNPGGVIGAWIAYTLYFFLGGPALVLFPLAIGLSAWHYFKQEESAPSFLNEHLINWLTFVLTIIACCGLASLHFVGHELPLTAGGRVGEVAARNFVSVFGMVGSTVLLTGLAVTGFTLMTGISWLKVMDAIGASIFRLLDWGKELRERRATQLAAEDREKRIVQRKKKLSIDTPPRIEPQVKSVGPSKRQRRERQIGLPQVKSSDELPALSLLDASAEEVAAYSEKELNQMAKQLEIKLQDFGIEAEVTEAQPGPIITRFELLPAPGTKASSISNLEKDLARSMSVPSLRVVEVIPGKSVVGIEIPNQRPSVVRLGEILGSQKYDEAKSPLTLALGKGITGEATMVNLESLPHLLAAGTTGAGKSVAVHVMLLSLLFKNLPRQVRLILIDPKMLELKTYENIPHLLTPVITDMNEAAGVLNWAVAEMERRYQLMASVGARNIGGLNQRIAEAQNRGQPLRDPLLENSDGEEGEANEAPLLEAMPYIVIVIDEFADMMMVAGKKVEELIIRLAQKARAAGLHLILATQRPSVDIITGLVKANIPARIAFQVSSKVDSRTILDQNGAEQLLGKGDMLFLAPGGGLPERIHGAFVSDREVAKVTDFLRRTGTPQYEDLLAAPTAGAGGAGGGQGDDPLFDEAVAIVTASNKASISHLQRRLKIGYNRAARMIEDMEAAGIVSAVQSNGSREVLAPREGRES